MDTFLAFEKKEQGWEFLPEIINEYLIITIKINNDIENVNFEESIVDVKKIFKFFKESRLKYGIIFDCSECDNIPIHALSRLLTYFAKKQKFFMKHLHASVALLKNEFIKNMLNVALYVYEPARPFTIMTGCAKTEAKKFIISNENKYIF
tara:strand:- start:368 stop:817 length:450 start_codon:yes stop_codon:yes gene_type:complete